MKRYIFITLVLVCGLIVAGATSLLDVAAAPVPISTTTTITFSENPATDGTIVMITATVSPNPGAGNGKIEIGVRQNPGTGEYLNCSNPGNSFAVKLTPANGVDIDANGQVSITFNTSGLYPVTGAIGKAVALSARYVGTGSGYGNSSSPCTDLAITAPLPPPCSGLTIAASLASGEGAPAPGAVGPWTFKIRVCNCTGVDLTNVKVQGGSNGWTDPTKTSAAADGTVSVKTNKGGAQTITWFTDLPNASCKEILVTVDGKIPNSALCDSIRFLSGPWSAVYDTGDGLGARKSEYTGRVSATVTCP